MSVLFEPDWMERFANQWNEDPALAGALKELGFNSVIAYGFIEDQDPKAIVKVENGSVISTEPYQGQDVDWDFRATDEQWRKWMLNPPGIMGLGVAFTSGSMKFMKGDYQSLVKDPARMAPLVESLSVMGKV